MGERNFRERYGRKSGRDLKRSVTSEGGSCVVKIGDEGEKGEIMERYWVHGD